MKRAVTAGYSPNARAFASLRIDAAKLLLCLLYPVLPEFNQPSLDRLSNSFNGYSLRDCYEPYCLCLTTRFLCSPSNTFSNTGEVVRDVTDVTH